jgi:hypothetical protein
MREQPFEILGIQPTDDDRAIRAAFVRLARIYHPDRFADQPEDVRAEAERRMKDATVAYESLLAAKREAKPDLGPTRKRVSDAELRDRAKRYREVMEARRAEEEAARVRWNRWDEIERRTRERAQHEAEIAAIVHEEVDPAAARAARPEPEARTVHPLSAPPLKASLLKRRLDSIAQPDALVPRPSA